MHEREVDSDARRACRTGQCWTIAYLALVLLFVKLDAFFGLTRPSGFADTMAGILAPIAAVWGVMAAKSPD